ncbi:efflux RND transporter periplasmic adaptor subunit [Actinomycetospora sp. TBRC 11914]|uniref:efflux RND transporter periplasmic adaptor subunit n=1 Tax=Actinomycetospora sp. TBRC 11914 TaxID=2729387 RepID=UPI00145D104B|nr:efflux RND transporter periplasmic adaptor subunit [Actinomycetospora sp. TBRC 11914]NMO89117.1 HlyD family efflux transporter periplasmic adaptor subunit [Actinomycetospora sp. TBRC 11914]
MPAGGSRRLLFVNGAIVLVLLLVAGGTTYALTRHASNANSSLRTTTVGRGTVAETVTAAGTVTTGTSATLNFSTTGRIAEVRVKLGDHVTQGQTVATLDGAYAQANLKALRSQVRADEQALKDAYYQRDHPQSTTSGTTTAGTSTAATAGMSTAATAGMSTAATAGTSTTGTSTTGTSTTGTSTTGTSTSGTSTNAGVQPPGHGLVLGGYFTRPGSGVEDVRPDSEQTSGGTSSTTSTGTSTATSTTGTSGTSTSSTTQQTSSDPGEANIRTALANLDTAKANVINAEQNLQNLDLVAPEDGTVVSLDGVVGQLVSSNGVVVSSTATGNPAGGRLPDGSSISSGASSGQSTTTGSSTSSSSGSSSSSSSTTSSSSSTTQQTAPAVMTIANLQAMQVLAQVPELDVGKVANGQPVAVSVNALAGQKIPGSVTAINLLPGSQSTVQYGTTVLMPTPPAGMRPGMSASVSITTRQATNVTFLPSAAVTPIGGADSGQATVQVLQPDGSTVQRTIGTGLASDTVTQVTSGLQVGDLVALPEAAATSTPRGGPGGGAPGGGGGPGGGAR